MISVRAKVLIGVALGAGAALTLAACGGASGGTKGPKPSEPLQDLTTTLMGYLHEGKYAKGHQLDVATEAVHQVTSDDGRPTGAYDGTRLLQAADTFAYGTPTILEPTFDKQGDGTATFNEIRHVVRHFDVDTSGGFGNAEARAFEAAVGITWMPAATR